MIANFLVSTVGENVVFRFYMETNNVKQYKIILKNWYCGYVIENIRAFISAQHNK